MRIAHIHNNKVHSIFDAAEMPVWPPYPDNTPATLVDITGKDINLGDDYVPVQGTEPITDEEGKPVLNEDGKLIYPTTMELVPNFENARVRKLEEIRSSKWGHIDGGFDYNGMKVASDADSQRLLNGAVTQCLIDKTYVCEWKMPDGSYINLNKAAIVAVASAMREHVQAAFTREKECLAAVAAATSYADLLPIRWNDAADVPPEAPEEDPVTEPEEEVPSDGGDTD